MRNFQIKKRTNWQPWFVSIFITFPQSDYVEFLNTLHIFQENTLVSNHQHLTEYNY